MSETRDLVAIAILHAWGYATPRHILASLNHKVIGKKQPFSKAYPKLAATAYLAADAAILTLSSQHASDCALHNGPAFEPGICDCRQHGGGAR